MVHIGEAAEKLTTEGHIESIDPDIYRDDPRWPAKCEGCNYLFNPLEDAWQVFQRTLYRRTDNGQEMTLEDAPAGAMWDASWMGDGYKGQDGQCLTVKMPGDHYWTIDGRASNCTSPCTECGRPYFQHGSGEAERKACPNGYKDARPHKCWVRHGTAPMLTVDKNGPTCNAGAGSIIVPGWHGFLRNGMLEPC